MKYKKQKRIFGGHKNKTYEITSDDKLFFMKEKNYDSFNHKLNYKEVARLDFVPELIFEDKKKLIWEFVKPEKLELNDESLQEMAKILYKLHNSNVKLPKTNHKARLLNYFEDLKNKKNKPKEIETFYQKAIDVIDSFDTHTPLHNDPWINNFILSNKKIYLVDWEYASFGDKHFDLAFAIDGSYLNSQQEKVFLNSYGEYSSKKLKDAKILVNYLTLVWMYRYDKLPFSDTPIIKNLYSKN